MLQYLLGDSMFRTLNILRPWHQISLFSESNYCIFVLLCLSNKSKLKKCQKVVRNFWISFMCKNSSSTVSPVVLQWARLGNHMQKNFSISEGNDQCTVGIQILASNHHEQLLLTVYHGADWLVWRSFFRAKREPFPRSKEQVNKGLFWLTISNHSFHFLFLLFSSWRVCFIFSGWRDILSIWVVILLFFEDFL